MAPHSSGLLSGAHMSSSQKASLMRSPKARTRGAGQRRMIARVVCVLIGALTLVLLLYFDKRRVEGAGQSMSGSRKGAHARGLHVDLAGGVQSRVGQVSLEGDVGRNGGMGEQWAGTPKHVDSSDDVAQGVGSGDRSGGGSKSDELEDGKVSLSSVGWFNGGGQKSDELETGSNTQPETVQENSVSDPDLVKRREEVARESVSATEPSMVKDLTSRGQENARALDHYLQRGGANAAKAETQLLSEADANPAATVNTATISNAPFNSSAQSGRIHTLEPIRTELRVYMYDLPAKFNWGLLSRAAELGVNASEPFSVKGPPFPVYQGGLSHQHSPEYWLTIDLLTDPATKEAGSSVARRVMEPSEADVFFVPYWASLAYNVYIPTRGEYAQELELQQELVDWLQSQELWKRSGGRDHLLVLHHPNAMAALRSRLSAAMWVLADFARYPPEEANLAKDVIAPYAHMVPAYEDDVDEERAWGARTTLLFFQGSLFRKRDGIVRELLLNVLKNEPDVIVREGSTDAEGVREASEGMRSARFCLHPAGDTPSSNRLFDAIFSHCVPVIVSDAIELPFEGDLDYRSFAIFVAARNAVTPGVLTEFLRSIPRRMWARMWARLHEVAPFFEYDNPASPTGAVNRVWREVALRLPSRRLEIHRALRRVHQTDTEGLRAMERRLQRMDPSFVKIQRKRPPAESASGTERKGLRL